MKRLIGITGAILLSYVIASSLLLPGAGGMIPTGADIAATEGAAMYTAREEDGRIVICRGNTALLRTDTQVASLPKIDRMRLREGIDLFSEEELKSFMEDYCS